MSKSMATGRPLGLTMIELLVVTAICAILLGVGIPSLRSWLVSQRVISTTGEIITDLRFARSDAISSNSTVAIAFKNNAGKGCYTVFRSPLPTLPELCDCSRGAGFACNTPSYTELKTYSLPASSDVSISGPQVEIYRPGSMLIDSWDPNVNKGFRVRVIAGAGKELNIVTTPVLPRPAICAPAGSKISGYKPCP
jgi:prepilin-type N-terminal cleavage/methylation domain-containing protein